MRKIYLVPFGGLGNRMRVMNSARAFIKDHPSRVFLTWLVKPELNIALPMLFSDTGLEYTPVRGFLYAVFRRLMKGVFIWKFERAYRLFFSLFFDTIIFDKDIKTEPREAILEKIMKGKKILLATCYDFYPFRDFSNFKLADGLNTIVKGMVKDFSDKTFGVHVRRTDHTALIKESPLEAYIEQVDELLAADPEADFYLATDDAAVKKEFRERYGKKIFTYETPLQRNSEAGMLGAVVDIYCLGYTRKIVCHTGSSFATTAALLEPGRPKQIIQIKQPVHPS